MKQARKCDKGRHAMEHYRMAGRLQACHGSGMRRQALTMSDNVQGQYFLWRVGEVKKGIGANSSSLGTAN